MVAVVVAVVVGGMVGMGVVVGVVVVGWGGARAQAGGSNGYSLAAQTVHLGTGLGMYNGAVGMMPFYPGSGGRAAGGAYPGPVGYPGASPWFVDPGRSRRPGGAGPYPGAAAGFPFPGPGPFSSRAPTYPRPGAAGPGGFAGPYPGPFGSPSSSLGSPSRSGRY